MLIPPFYENFGKRLVKTPKLYFVDSGLLCHLLGIQNKSALINSPFCGAIYEGFTASEILKHRINRGQEKNLYYFRDQQGLEIDFLVDRGNNELLLLEVKASRTPKPFDAAPMLSLKKNIKGRDVSAWLVHAGSGDEPSVLCEGAGAISINALNAVL